MKNLDWDLKGIKIHIPSSDDIHRNEYIVSVVPEALYAYDLKDTLGNVYEAGCGNRGLVRSKMLYMITELEDKSLIIESESLDSMTAICSLLNSMGIKHNISELEIDFSFRDKLESFASLYTKNSPEVPISKSMFDVSKDGHYFTEFTFRFNTNHLYSIEDFSQKVLNDAIDKCEFGYQVVDCWGYVEKEDIVKIDFSQETSEFIKNIVSKNIVIKLSEVNEPYILKYVERHLAD